ncbi:MAG: M61 family peptidase, partial [Chitinophagaceae bacterium]
MFAKTIHHKTMIKFSKFRLAGTFLLVLSQLLQSPNSKAQDFSFVISTKNPASHYINVEMQVKDLKAGIIDFKIPVWTPGYYQFLNFHENVENLSIEDDKGNVLEYAKSQPNAWRIKTKAKASYKIRYDIKTVRPFVATPYVDTARAYLSPPGVFLHVAGMLNKPVEVRIVPWGSWNRVSTGLDSVVGKSFTYRADNFDVLYDSPILIGNLEEIPPFEVDGKPHRFIGYKLGEFDRPALMNDLKKIVQTSADLIGDVPYKHYTFIPIGPGGGGIEHLNSTTISFSGGALNNPKSRLGIMNFIAHEYFHHYNVKRIRPIELGPFDYDKGSKTKMLWVSEGLSVYYEYLVVRRAGLSTDEQLIESLHDNIL